MAWWTRLCSGRLAALRVVSYPSLGRRVELYLSWDEARGATRNRREAGLLNQDNWPPDREPNGWSIAAVRRLLSA